MKKIAYSKGIRDAFDYLLENYNDVCLMGQGLWSPWYVGSSMNDLEHKFGKDRVLDTPVSENATTGMALGASLTGLKAVVVHPRMDFMILATDQIVNQAAKWQSMLGGNIKIPLTIRGIINRGGEQGAQHSQALHSWYAHIPGLKVVMPATAIDARDLLVASVLSNDPVLYIDDRWCYESESDFKPIEEINLNTVIPQKIHDGNDITIVSCSYTSLLSLEAAKELKKDNVNVEIIDLRLLNPLNINPIINSVEKTGRLLVVDGGWLHYGLTGEIIASVAERITFKNSLPQRLAIENSPAPTSKYLESEYYITSKKITDKILQMIKM